MSDDHTYDLVETRLSVDEAALMLQPKKAVVNAVEDDEWLHCAYEDTILHSPLAIARGEPRAQRLAQGTLERLGPYITFRAQMKQSALNGSR